MKKQNPIRILLGITQDDMAMLLKITRSQWSMFEIGKRDLPIAAKLLLAEMLAYLKNPKMLLEAKPHVVVQEQKNQQQLKDLLFENDYQLQLTVKKITVLEKKYTSKLRILELVDFLSGRDSKKELFGESLLRNISNKAAKALEVEGLALLVKYQLKKEVLELEKLLLESKLRKYTLSSVNIEGYN